MTRVKEQSIEVDPKVFQVVQEKQIGVETAVADHVFFSKDATIANPRPFDSREKFSVPPRKVVKSTNNAAPSERVKVDVGSSDCTCQKGSVDTFIKSVDSVCFQLRPDDFTVSVGVANFKFQALLDTGAAVSAVSARIWREYLVDIHPNLNPPARGAVATVNGCELVTLGTLVLSFDIDAESFPAKADVIEGLAFDVIIGRDFLQEFCSRIDFVDNVVEFVHVDDPLPFDLSRLDDDPDVDDSEFVSSVHADFSFTIPPHSEKIILGKLKDMLGTEDVCGIVIPRSDLPHHYSIFGAAEIVKVLGNGTIPIRLVNPSAQSVKIFHKTGLGDFSSVGNEVETFELRESPQEVLPAMSEDQIENKLPHRDYSDLPDL